MKDPDTPEANPKVLVVDDDPAVRRMLKRILRPDGYEVQEAADGSDAIRKAASQAPDLVLLDMMMPGMNGMEVAEKLKADPATKYIAVILLTGLAGVEVHVKALAIGADDFLSKTAYPEEIAARVKFHVARKKNGDRLRANQQYLKQAVESKTSQLNFVSDRLKDVSLEVIWRLTAASEYRDNDTGAHIQRMSHYAAAIARRFGLKAKVVDNILYAAPMHDIGKIGIPDRVLLKPGKLDAQEWEMMRMHCAIGADILKGSKIGFVQLGAVIALTHHEKWDGSGYPRGLKGRQIPLAGRIVALADVFDALTSQRPYKEAFSLERSLGIIRDGREKHFDPDVADAFFDIQTDILKIKELFQDSKESPLVCFGQLSGAVANAHSACGHLPAIKIDSAAAMTKAV